MLDQEAQTNHFLRTNGPNPGEFEPDIPPQLLKGKSEDEQWLYREVNRGNKMSEWLIPQVVGLKGAHRIIHERMVDVKKDLAAELGKGNERFSKIEAEMAPFLVLREKWLTRKKMIRNILLAMLTIFLLPALSVLLAEVLKPGFLKLLGIHP